MIEAYGNKGLKNTPWRKTFKNSDKMLEWAEKNDATVLGTRELEHAVDCFCKDCVAKAHKEDGV